MKNEPTWHILEGLSRKILSLVRKSANRMAPQPRDFVLEAIGPWLLVQNPEAPPFPLWIPTFGSAWPVSISWWPYDRPTNLTNENGKWGPWWHGCKSISIISCPTTSCNLYVDGKPYTLSNFIPRLILGTRLSVKVCGPIVCIPNSTYNSGCWIGLGIVEYNYQLRIT